MANNIRIFRGTALCQYCCKMNLLIKNIFLRKLCENSVNGKTIRRREDLTTLTTLPIRHVALGMVEWLNGWNTSVLVTLNIGH